MINRNWLLAILVGIVLISESTALKCMKCKDSETENCSQGPGTLTDCAVDETLCFQRNEQGKIERGCMKAEEQANCPTGGGKSCYSCNTEGCNNEPWLKCHVCDSSDAACVSAQEANKDSACSNFVLKDQCYAKVVDNKVTRGCKSSLATNGDVCTDNKYCDACSENGCNKQSIDELKAYPKCLECTSLNSANCEPGTVTPTECPKRDDSCYTLVGVDKILRRGCLSQLTVAEQNNCKTDNEKDTKTCAICNKDGCNKLDWLKCHQCKETETTNCAEEQPDNAAEFCSAVRETNRCYERLESGKMARGCETDLTTPGYACTDNTQCRVCIFNACNKEASSTLLTTERCLQCTTSKDTDGSCLLGTVLSTPCAKDSSNKCYSMTDNDGILTRGCQGDLTADQITKCATKTCTICENAGCNKNVFPTGRLRCYQCKTTDADKTCSQALTGESRSSYCKVYKDDDKCYSRITKGVFERGCQSDLKEASCEGLTAKECLLCTGENCNGISEEKLKGSAGQKAISSILVAAVVAFVVLK